MLTEIIIAVLGVIGAAVGAFAANRKSTALITFRLDSIENKLSEYEDAKLRTIKLDEHKEVCRTKFESLERRIQALEEARG